MPEVIAMKVGWLMASGWTVEKLTQPNNLQGGLPNSIK